MRSIKISRKWSPLFQGPFEVIQNLDKNLYTILAIEKGDTRVFNVYNLCVSTGVTDLA